jgi:hypothetical protein
LGLATIFYCLRFETSHFVASYDSQGHGGGIRPRPHTSVSHSGEGQLLKSRYIASASTTHRKQPILLQRSVHHNVHSSVHGADRIESVVFLLLPRMCLVARCLTVSYLATLCPSTLQYVYFCFYCGSVF